MPFESQLQTNANYVWRADLKRELVFAIRSIAQGEQITVSYIGPHMRAAQRQQRLQTKFGFTCVCSSCVNATEESDASLQEIQEFGLLYPSLESVWTFYRWAQTHQPWPQDMPTLLQLSQTF